MKKCSLLSATFLGLVFILIFPQFLKGQEIRLQVVVEKANLRASPDLSSTVVIQVTAGTALSADKKEGEWFRIILPPDSEGVRKIAYVHFSVVEVLSPKVEPAQKERDVTQKAEAKPTVPQKQGAPDRVSDVSQLTDLKTPESLGVELGLRLYGGYDFFIGPNTMNDAYQGANRYFSDFVAFLTSHTAYTTLDGSLEPLESGPLAGGEFFVNISPYLGFGLGAGIFSGQVENSLEVNQPMEGILITETHSQKVSVPFVQLTIYGGLPLGKMLRIVPYAGGGLYLGTVTLGNKTDYKTIPVPMEYYVESSWTSQNLAFGFHGGLNFELNFTRNVGLFFGAGGILASFKNLVGDSEWSGWSSVLGSESGTDRDLKLWGGEMDMTLVGLGTYSTYWLEEKKPDEVLAKNIKPGVISISQFRLVFGVNIFFKR